MKVIDIITDNPRTESAPWNESGARRLTFLSSFAHPSSTYELFPVSKTKIWIEADVA